MNRYAYSEEVGDEFDRDNTFTFIKPAPLSSKSVQSVSEATPLQSSSGITNGDLEEDKRE